MTAGCSLMLRIAGFLGPFLLLPLSDIYYKNPYIAFSISNAIAVFLSFTLKQETAGEDLDGKAVPLTKTIND